MKLTDLRFTHNSHSKTPFLFLFYSVFNAAAAADQAPAPQYLKLGPELSRPIAAVIVLLVFVFFVIVFLFVYLRHYLELNAASDAALRAAAGSDRCNMCRGLDPDVIRTFPVVAHSEIKDTKFAKWSLECAVCLSEFRDCETLRLLPKCGHVFHPACIDAWLASCATCPICRAMLAAGGGNSAAEFVAVADVDRNDVDGEPEAVGSSSEDVCVMELGGSVGGPTGSGDKTGDVAAIC